MNVSCANGRCLKALDFAMEVLTQNPPNGFWGHLMAYFGIPTVDKVMLLNRASAILGIWQPVNWNCLHNNDQLLWAVNDYLLHEGVGCKELLNNGIQVSGIEGIQSLLNFKSEKIFSELELNEKVQVREIDISDSILKNEHKDLCRIVAKGYYLAPSIKLLAFLYGTPKNEEIHFGDKSEWVNSFEYYPIYLTSNRSYT
jgi:hypothetical protein